MTAPARLATVSRVTRGDDKSQLRPAPLSNGWVSPVDQTALPPGGPPAFGVLEPCRLRVGDRADGRPQGQLAVRLDRLLSLAPLGLPPHQVDPRAQLDLGVH